VSSKNLGGSGKVAKGVFWPLILTLGIHFVDTFSLSFIWRIFFANLECPIIGEFWHYRRSSTMGVAPILMA
jgi:hypothetical protein